MSLVMLSNWTPVVADNCIISMFKPWLVSRLILWGNLYCFRREKKENCTQQAEIFEIMEMLICIQAHLIVKYIDQLLFNTFTL